MSGRPWRCLFNAWRAIHQRAEPADEFILRFSFSFFFSVLAVPDMFLNPLSTVLL